MNIDAQQLLDAVKPFGVTGLTIRDVADEDTWTFLPFSLSPEQVAATTNALRAALRPPPPPAVTITKIAFLRLLQPDEYAAFVKGAAADSVLLWGKALLDAAMSLSPTEPSFVQLLQYCVGTGIFSPERAAAILAGMQG